MRSCLNILQSIAASDACVNAHLLFLSAHEKRVSEDVRRQRYYRRVGQRIVTPVHTGHRQHTRGRSHDSATDHNHTGGRLSSH